MPGPSDFHRLEQRVSAYNEQQTELVADLDRAETLVVVLDTSGRILKFNRVCEALTGIAGSAVVGQPIWQLSADPVDPQAMALVQAAARGLVAGPLLTEWLDRQGVRRRIRWSSTTLTGIDGQAAFIVCIGLESHPDTVGEFDVGTWEVPDAEPERLETLADEAEAAAGHPQVGAAISWVRAHFCDPISLKDVAEAVGYSPAYLTDLCRRVTGRTVQAWIIGWRMLEARRLLLTTDWSVDAIAGHIGYLHAGHFGRQFRRYHRMPPRAWQRIHGSRPSNDPTPPHTGRGDR